MSSIEPRSVLQLPFPSIETQFMEEVKTPVVELQNIQIQMNRQGVVGNNNVDGSQDLEELVKLIQKISLDRIKELREEINAMEPEFNIWCKQLCVYAIGAIGISTIAGAFFLPDEKVLIVVGAIIIVAAFIFYCHYRKKIKDFEEERLNFGYKYNILSQFQDRALAIQAAQLYMEHMEKAQQQNKSPVSLNAYIGDPVFIQRLLLPKVMDNKILSAA